MIQTVLQEVTRKSPAREFIISNDKGYSYDDSFNYVLYLAGVLAKQNSKRCAFYARNCAEIILGLAAAAQAEMQSCVLNRHASLSEIEELVRRFEIDTVFSDCSLSLPQTKIVRLDQLPHSLTITGPVSISEIKKDAEIIILTSGTTGQPKGALYRWSDLLAQARREERLFGARWLLTYNLNHFAGFQMLVHALINAGTLIIPQTQAIPDVLEAIKLHKVEYVSATPTFWRMLVGYLEHSPASDLHLKHITIGGEPATEDILQRLRQHFPDIPISQVFATAEFGSCFSVKDGLPGFPVSYLQPGKTRVPLKIINGELFVRSPHAMLKYWGDDTSSQNKWQSTGDLVEVVGDRVLFLGRKSEVVNVGGVKVHPHKIETVILRASGVFGVRVYGLPNPITGQIVAAELTIEPGYQGDQVLEQVRAYCREKLDRYHQPRRLRIVEALSTVNQKILRRTSIEA